MTSKVDLMASLMGVGDGDGKDNLIGVVDTETTTTSVEPTTSTTDKLFADDEDDDPPPFTTDDAPPTKLPSSLLNGTSNSLFGNDTIGGDDDLFANSPEPTSADHDVPLSTVLPAVPTVPPPPLPPVPPPASAPPLPTPTTTNVTSGGGLFDDIDSAENNSRSVVPVTPPPKIATTTAKTSTGLAESGLLGADTSERADDLLFPKTVDAVVENSGHDSSLSCMGGKGGLFDDVDQLESQNAERERQRQQIIAKEEEERKIANAALAQQEVERSNQAATAEQKQNEMFLQQERIKREQLDIIYYTQSLQDQMQSIHLGTATGGFPPGQQQQQIPPHMMMQQQQQQQYNNQQMMMNNGYQSSVGGGVTPQQQQSQLMMNPPVKKVTMDFYRDPEPMPGVAPHSNGINHQQPATPTTPRFYKPDQPGNFAAGLHNATPPQGMLQQQQNQQFLQQQHQHQQSPGGPMYNSPGQQMQMQQYQQYLPVQSGPPPTVTEPLYGRVMISDPILVQSEASFFGVRQPPHWNYQITTELTPANGGGGVWIVRRRFRHVVSLEDRLREDCPGAILPPRPDKHATRAIEEASASQSFDFAMQRAAELQMYLNEIVHHPICYKSPVLHFFLALQDDLGVAWGECSGNTLTRLANVGVGAALKVSETSTTSKLPWQSTPDDIGGGEDNGELLALQGAESIRMGMVQQAVPKMEGAVTLLREFAELSGSTGMELSRLVKELQHSDIELAQPFDIVSAGLLRSGRRSKRLAIECAAAIYPYQHHYKMCRYEKFAFQDRKNALQRRHKERMKADQRAAQLLMHQRASAMSYNPNNPYQSQQKVGYPYGDRVLAQEAATADSFALDVWNDADEIGTRLKSEVYRTAWTRRSEWAASLKVIASSMKEAMTERVGIWETIQENFLQAFPDYKNESVSTTIDGAANMASPQMMMHGSTMISESTILQPSSPIVQSHVVTTSMVRP